MIKEKATASEAPAAGSPRFTPGPWLTNSWMHQRSAPKIHVESTDKGSGYARICTLTPRNNGPAIYANAALIAAAPDLYLSLKALLEDFEAINAVPFHGAEARAALAKADGKAAP